MNIHESIAQKLKKDPRLMLPFDGEELWGIPLPVDTMGVPTESHAPSQKKRLGKRERPNTSFRCQEPEIRTVMMTVSLLDELATLSATTSFIVVLYGRERQRQSKSTNYRH